jgi:hypothetical protein
LFFDLEIGSGGWDGSLESFDCMSGELFVISNVADGGVEDRIDLIIREFFVDILFEELA